MSDEKEAVPKCQDCQQEVDWYVHDTSQCIEFLQRERDELREALEGVVAESYSWVILEETARIEQSIHARYRKRALAALAESTRGKNPQGGDE